MYSNLTSFLLFSHRKVFLLVIFIICPAYFAVAQQEQTVADNSTPKNEKSASEIEETKDQSLFDQQELFGSFFGVRNTSTPIGIEFDGTIKNDLWRNYSGGNDQLTSDLFNIDVTASTDLQEAIGWNSASLFIHFLGNNGKSVSNSVGDFQKISNIEAYPMGKLYQCWLQQKFFDNKLSLLAGLFDLNSEFYVTPTSGLFLNSSHGIGIDLGQTGNNGPSIFPNAALAFRISYVGVDNSYTQFAVFDGMPGDPNDPTKFGISLSSADGYFAVAEFGFEKENVSKVGFGVWKYSGSFTDLCSEVNPSVEIRRSDNYGGYILIDQMLYHNLLSSTEGLHGFARFGIANGHVNRFDFHIGGGVVYIGIFSSREEDEFGYAVASAHASRDYRAFIQSVYLTSVSAETSHELTYKMKFAEWFSLQYDVQYVVHPSANPSIPNALVGGVRLEVNL